MLIRLKERMLLLTLFIVVLTGMNEAHGQITLRELKGGDLNTINTAVPFITIAPDSRASGMGDVGVATHPDMNSQHWNVAKYPFIEEDGGLAITYTPWLKNLGINDINLAYLSTYFKPSRDQVISTSLRFFSLGSIQFTDLEGIPMGDFTPFELAVDAGYSRLFTDNLSGGIVFRYIHSDLKTRVVSEEDAKPGIAFAADLGFYYQNDFRLDGKDVNWAAGISLSNLGTPISYTVDAEAVPLPSNMRLGTSFEFELDDFNSISVSLDLNKLLVPTPPIYLQDTVDDEGDLIVDRGKEPSSIVQGMAQSFWDAPGINYDDGTYSTRLREELAEFMIGFGAEYWYRDQFAIRTGYFHESAVKGNRKYLTFGVGLKLNIFSLDFAYLVPTNGMQSPLANTIRFSLGFDFANFR
jgi:hypothetical protein